MVVVAAGTRSPRSVRVGWLGALGAVGYATYTWLLDDLAAQLFWNVVVAVIVVAALVLALRRRQQRPWLAIVGGYALFAVADICFTVVHHVVGTSRASSVADVFYLAGYAVVAAGLLALSREDGRRDDHGALVDGLVVAVSAAVLVWIGFGAPTAVDDSRTLLDRAIGVSYPAGDLLLITMGAQLVARSTRLRASILLLLGALLASLAADLGYLYLVLYDTYEGGELVDLGWWAGYLLVLAAVAHRDEPEAPPVVPSEPRLTSSRLAVLAVIALAAPTALAVRLGRGDTADGLVLVAGTMIVFVLVISRLALVARELEQSRGRQAHAATHDPLTGLANRSLFADRIDEAMAASHDQGHAPIALCIDLDDFKAVNDSLGHGAGDRLLCILADRLRDEIGPDHLVARLGGDEFAVLLRDTEPRHAAELAEHLVAAIEAPADVGAGRSVSTRVSIGIAQGSADGDRVTLLGDADLAMYAAKASAGSAWALFHHRMRDELAERIEERTAFSGALAAGQLLLEYQPVVAIRSGAVRFVEARVVWARPGGPRLQDDRVRVLADDTGTGAAIGRWMLQEATRAVMALDADPHGIGVAVSLHPLHLASPDLVGDVHAALERSGLPPGRLVVAIGESTTPEDLDRMAAVVMRLRSLGVQVALDRVGNGYGTIPRLRHLPVDLIVLPPELAAAVAEADLAVLEGFVAVARSLGVGLVGTGVDEPEHRELLVAAGCNYVQGSLIAMPMSSIELHRHVAAELSPPAAERGAMSPRS